MASGFDPGRVSIVRAVVRPSSARAVLEMPIKRLRPNENLIGPDARKMRVGRVEEFGAQGKTRQKRVVGGPQGQVKVTLQKTTSMTTLYCAQSCGRIRLIKGLWESTSTTSRAPIRMRLIHLIRLSRTPDMLPRWMLALHPRRCPARPRQRQWCLWLLDQA